MARSHSRFCPMYQTGRMLLECMYFPFSVSLWKRDTRILFIQSLPLDCSRLAIRLDVQSRITARSSISNCTIIAFRSLQAMHTVETRAQPGLTDRDASTVTGGSEMMSHWRMLGFQRFKFDILCYPAVLLFVKMRILEISPRQTVTISHTSPKPTDQRHLAYRPIFPSKKGMSLINMIHYAEEGRSEVENCQKSPQMLDMDQPFAACSNPARTNINLHSLASSR
ncbi:hypothetical protein DL98DRAFT_252846 [Cadophora sp. DSE1049]|nr:hypothetical protein DL98DRAFT_252846 [Cadophora sp. DSE1049]